MTTLFSSFGRLICGILALAMPLALFAATPPALTHYQGVLRGAADEPLTGAYDMVFRFFDAEAGGNEVMVDQHLAVNAQAIMVEGGLFSVALGSGTVIDGSGPGTCTSLADLFANHAGVWLEAQIGTETLAPRTRVLASGYALNATTAASATTAGTAATASLLNGQPSSFFLDTSPTHQTKNGTIRFSANDPSLAVVDAAAAAGSLGAIAASSSGATCKFAYGSGGTECYGSSFGGFFQDTTYGAWGYGGYAGHGLYGSGAIGVRGYGAGTSAYGGYFTAPNSLGIGVYGSGVYGGQFAASGGGSRAVYGAGGTYGGYFTGSSSSSGAGVFGSAALYGGHFQTTSTSGIAGRFEQTLLPGTFTNVAYSGYGIWSRSVNGIHNWDDDDSTYARIGASPYKIVGSGTVSFIQNHPDEPDQVVIYHAPESSEVNVYTRGSAKLSGGAARIELDPTFEWTANPDVGLTAHLTPRGEPVALAVESVTSRELMVRGPHGSDVEFDYWVTGLRIGFEEMPPVSEKEFESPLPSEASGRSVYAVNPGLRAFNALERYRAMGQRLGRPIDPDLRASVGLRDRIGIGKPMAAGANPMPRSLRDRPAARAEGLQVADEDLVAAKPSDAPLPAVAVEPERGQGVDSDPAIDVRRRLSQFFPTTSPIEAGDVIVDDPHERGSVKRADQPGDRSVIGVALSSVSRGRVEVAMAAVVEVRADAVYGSILAGDLLMTSPTPGAAMLATAPEPGTILGKALDPLESGTGMIRVVVMLR